MATPATIATVKAARNYDDLWLGLTSGMFACLQVLVSVSSAQSNRVSLATFQRALADLSQGGGSDPFLVAGGLVPVVVTTYTAMLAGGLICLALCWIAGRRVALEHRTRVGGGLVGLNVALVSGIVWLVVSLLATYIFRADGSITGVVTSAPGGPRLGAELVGLFVQELLAVLITLGLGAVAGELGAHTVRLPATPMVRRPFVVAYAPPWPAPTYYPYPPQPGYPPYPPPPGYPPQVPYAPPPGYPPYPPTPMASPPTPPSTPR